jgi:geranylgeranyl reductase family protein
MPVAPIVEEHMCILHMYCIFFILGGKLYYGNVTVFLSGRGKSQVPKNYDCIIIGAGPSGAVAAYCLSIEGINILLLEGRKLPRDKICGGFISKRAEMQLPFDLSRYLLHERKAYKVEYYSSRGVDRHQWDREIGYFIDRKDFDYQLVEEAAKAGTTVIDLMRVEEVSRSDGGFRVRSGKNCFTAKYLIGADGVNGITSKQFGLNCMGGSPLIGFALNLKIPAVSGERRVCRFFSLPFAAGLGWCFTGPDSHNIGLGASIYFRKRLFGILPRFVDEIRKIVGQQITGDRFKGAFLPSGWFKRRIADRGAFLVGDAAGLVEPFSGEGLFAAVLSGKEAAKVILRTEKNECCRAEKEYTEYIHRRLVSEYRHSIVLSLLRYRLEAMGLVGEEYIGACMMGNIMKGEDSYSRINKRLMKEFLINIFR